MQTDAARTYQRQAVLTASKEKLIVLLYQGALRFTDVAIRSLEKEDHSAFADALSRGFAVVGELRTSLDHDNGGEIAASLDRLYAFVQDRMVQANRARNRAPLKEAREILATLKEGWDGILGGS